MSNQSDKESNPIGLSIVIPILDERENLTPLVDELEDTLEELNLHYEIVLVDDGSTDGSTEVIEGLCAGHSSVSAIIMRSKVGKAEALAAGFGKACGDIVFTMDGDLQDVPAEIPKFLEEIDKGFDVVSGWKHPRHDPIGKVLPSKVFNLLLNSITGVRLHDHNSGFKAYKREVIEEIRPYGELHRFMAVLAKARGFAVSEVVVRHRPRQHGYSKYGIGRIPNGLLDMLTLTIAILYETRPLHVFGKLGLIFAAIGGIAGVYLTVLWLFQEEPIGGRPLLFFAVLSILFGAQLLGLGLIAEIIVRGRSARNPPIRRVID